MATLAPQEARDSQFSVATLINPASTYFRCSETQTAELFHTPNVEEIVVEKEIKNVQTVAEVVDKDIPNVNEPQESQPLKEETAKVVSLLSPLEPPLGVGVLSTEEVQRIRRIFSGLAPLPSLRSTSLDQ